MLIACFLTISVKIRCQPLMATSLTGLFHRFLEHHGLPEVTQWMGLSPLNPQNSISDE
jgi:hypothetical protein